MSRCGRNRLGAGALVAGGLASACAPAPAPLPGLTAPEVAAADVWRAARARGATPEEFVQACDELAGRLLDAGDPNGAAGVLQRCREALRELVDADDARAARLGQHLARMRSLERLRAAQVPMPK